MRKAIILIVPLLVLALLFLYSKKTNDTTGADITKFYTANDSTGYVTYIDSLHWDTRVQIANKLGKFLSAGYKNDSTEINNLTSELTWLVSLYEQSTGVKDLTKTYDLFLSWNNNYIEIKFTLDSQYNTIKKTKDSLPLGIYLERLKDIRLQYAHLLDSFTLAGLDYQLARGYYSQQLIDSSQLYLSQSKNICLELDNFFLLAQCQLLAAKISNIYYGDYFKSEKAYLNAIKYYQMVGDNYNVLDAYLGLGYDYFQLGQTEKAIKYARSALGGFKTYKNTGRVAYCMNFLAEIYINKDDLDSALHFATRSLELRKDIAGKKNDSLSASNVANSESTIGRIYQAQKNTNKALEKYLQADTIFGSIGDISGFCLNMNRFASLYLEEKDYEIAEDMYRNVLKLTDKFEETIFSAFGLALCQYYTSEIDKAIQNLNACIRLFEESRQKLPIPDLKTGMLSDKIGFYHLLTNIYIQQYENSGDEAYFDSAFSCIERSKAAALIDMLSISDRSIITGAEDRLLREISRMYRALMLGKGEPTIAIQEIERLEVSLERLRIENAGQNIYLLSDHLAGQIGRHEVQQRLLQEHDVLLEYMISEIGSYVMIIGKDSFDAIPIKQNYQHLDQTIREYITAIRSSPEKLFDSDGAMILGKRLYTSLIPDKLLEQSSIENIIVVSSGLLDYLPFEALIDENEMFFVEKYNVSYAPSATTIDIINNRNKSTDLSNMILAFGNPIIHDNHSESLENNEKLERDFRLFDKSKAKPLPNTLKEIESIKDIFGVDRAIVYISENATEKNFKAVDFSKIKYIHLASHGITDEYYPNRSAILFSRSDDSTDDGLLHPDEITRLNMAAEFIFLSACQTGSGKLYPGEGVISLARPFLAAGCNSAIVSLWNINDKSSALFVSHFYKNIAGGKSKAHALALAKREFINSPRKLYRHPYFWAPFIVVGLGN